MLTPLDIESKVFKKRLLGGYNKNDVENFMERVLVDYEDLYKNNIDLKEKCDNLTEIIAEYDKIKETLNNSILVAEKAAEDTRANALKEAENIKMEANLRLSKFKDDINRLEDDYEARKIEIKRFLQTQLDMIERFNISNSNQVNVEEN
jgi:cell division initiation protein